MRLMRSAALFALAALAATGLAVAQAPLPRGTQVNAELKTKLDTQHAKVGDPVIAVTTEAVKAHRVILLPKGATLSGRITEVVAAESGKSPSHLAVLFDRAVSKQGVAIPLRAAIAKVIMPNDSAMDMGSDDMMPMPSPQPMPNGDMGADNSSSNHQTATLGDEPVPPIVTAAAPAAIARGSNGKPIRVQLPGSEQSAQNGSVLSTPQGDLKLNSGTRVVLLILPD